MAREALHLFAPGGKEPVRSWRFKRQKTGDQLCLSDYVLAPKDGKRIILRCLLSARAKGFANARKKAKHGGYYFKSLAGACVEWLHRRIREDWGFPDSPEMTMALQFTLRYRGKRYSFGYPACPKLEDQAQIWKLLRPVEIGVQLTEGFMMDPEASVSALAFHHPNCTYFSVGESESAA
jgi:5-methyltetrahydrofolate--homocysteine methyltransferase